MAEENNNQYKNSNDIDFKSVQAIYNAKIIYDDIEKISKQIQANFGDEAAKEYKKAALDNAIKLAQHNGVADGNGPKVSEIADLLREVASPKPGERPTLLNEVEDSQEAVRVAILADNLDLKFAHEITNTLEVSKSDARQGDSVVNEATLKTDNTAAKGNEPAATDKNPDRPTPGKAPEAAAKAPETKAPTPRLSGGSNLRPRGDFWGALVDNFKNTYKNVKNWLDRVIPTERAKPTSAPAKTNSSQAEGKNTKSESEKRTSLDFRSLVSKLLPPNSNPERAKTIAQRVGNDNRPAYQRLKSESELRHEKGNKPARTSADAAPQRAENGPIPSRAQPDANQKSEPKNGRDPDGAVAGVAASTAQQLNSNDNGRDWEERNLKPLSTIEEGDETSRSSADFSKVSFESVSFPDPNTAPERDNNWVDFENGPNAFREQAAANQNSASQNGRDPDGAVAGVAASTVSAGAENWVDFDNGPNPFREQAAANQKLDPKNLTDPEGHVATAAALAAQVRSDIARDLPPIPREITFEQNGNLAGAVNNSVPVHEVVYAKQGSQNEASFDNFSALTDLADKAYGKLEPEGAYHGPEDVPANREPDGILLPRDRDSLARSI